MAFSTLRPSSAREFGRPIQILNVDNNISSTINELFGTSLTEEDQRNIGASPELARTALLMVGEVCGTFESADFENKFESVLRHCRAFAAPSQVFTPEVDVIAAITALFAARHRYSPSSTTLQQDLQIYRQYNERLHAFATDGSATVLAPAIDLTGIDVVRRQKHLKQLLNKAQTGLGNRAFPAQYHVQKPMRKVVRDIQVKTVPFIPEHAVLIGIDLIHDTNHILYHKALHATPDIDRRIYIWYNDQLHMRAGKQRIQIVPTLSIPNVNVHHRIRTLKQKLNAIQAGLGAQAFPPKAVPADKPQPLETLDDTARGSEPVLAGVAVR